MSITLTAQAAEHINKHIEKRGSGLGLRLGVRLTGCSGMAYDVDYVDQANENDHIFEDHGVKVFVDPRSLPFVDGTEIDFVRQGLSATFKFKNPNEKAACGCGESFMV
ncbi:MAG: iron-sulfur cluster assembly protein IscA [Alcaligenaceae bacterium]|uniref:Iron-binding protein IscA n=1 Tax=Paenalcaligenes hermetiae TaxID=1157987 RepID=A0ABP9LZ73_9BURK|nr:iron-sulfur cluster assembly protein IscA [Paenalcaligenes sp.]NLJ62151.1 iron-sulfur cluster assembly protein IscA [Alcaligenaceae bacterium]